MKPIRRLAIIIALLAAVVLPAAATAQTPSCSDAVYNCFILRVAPDLYEAVMQGHDLTLAVEVRSGDPRVALVTGPTSLLPETTLANLDADPDVVSAELVEATALTEGAAGAGVDTAAPAFQAALTSTGTHSGPETAYFSTPLWNGYINQPATTLMNVDDAHADPRPEALGLGVVAIIDTGVDPNHPLLQGALLPGYDFILEQAGDASEWNALDPVVHATTEQDLQGVADQSYSSIVDGNGTAFIEQSYSSIVDQSYSSIVDQSYSSIVDGKDLPPGFGHGTMVAGLVRLVAPAAMILPIRVFDEMGQGDLGDIVRAIYWAVDNGANVINMSFSTRTYSAELHRAIMYANQNQVVCVSSVGNEARIGLTYPSAFGAVIGVASTSDQDQISDFSNFGFGLVFLGAAGEGLVTSFPGGLYAAAWGTSFSSALVSGTAALLHTANGGDLIPVNYFQAAQALTVSALHVQPFRLGAGRMDSNHAMNCGPTGGSCNP
jgi:subtilisin family serine protease